MSTEDHLANFQSYRMLSILIYWVFFSLLPSPFKLKSNSRDAAMVRDTVRFEFGQENVYLQWFFFSTCLHR